VIEIIVSIIGALATIIAVVVNSRNSRKDMINELQRQQERSDARLEQTQAVTNTKLEALTEEVREHNNFARRMPVVEEQIKVINHRLSDLEHKTA
jgi:heme exporter protein D